MWGSLNLSSWPWDFQRFLNWKKKALQGLFLNNFWKKKRYAALEATSVMSSATGLIWEWGRSFNNKRKVIMLKEFEN